MSPKLAMIIQPLVDDVNYVCEEDTTNRKGQFGDSYGLCVAEAISDICATEGPHGSVDVALRTLIWIPE